MFEKIVRFAVLAVGVTVAVFGLLIAFGPGDLVGRTLYEIGAVTGLGSQTNTLFGLLFALAGIGGLVGVTTKDTPLAVALIIAAALVAAVGMATILDSQWLAKWSNNDVTLIRSVYGVAFIGSGLLFLVIPALFFYQKRRAASYPPHAKVAT